MRPRVHPSTPGGKTEVLRGRQLPAVYLPFDVLLRACSAGKVGVTGTCVCRCLRAGARAASFPKSPSDPTWLVHRGRGQQRSSITERAGLAEAPRGALRLAVTQGIISSEAGGVVIVITLQEGWLRTKSACLGSVNQNDM